MADLEQYSFRCLGTKEGNRTVRPGSRKAVGQFGPVSAKLIDTGLQILYLKAEMVDRSRLRPNDIVLASVRPGVMEKFDQSVPDREKCYSYADLF